MNQGQYNAILGMLTEIRDLLKAKNERPMITRNYQEPPMLRDVSDAMKNLKIEPTKTARRGRPKKVSQ